MASFGRDNHLIYEELLKIIKAENMDADFFGNSIWLFTSPSSLSSKTK